MFYFVSIQTCGVYNRRARLQDDVRDEKLLVREVKKKVQANGLDDMKRYHIYALQTPTILMPLSVMTSLVGLSTVGISPVAKDKTWNSHAKVGVEARSAYI